MEFEETAAIRNRRRQIEFPRLKWLNKEKFEEYIKQKKPVYPFTLRSPDYGGGGGGNDELSIDTRTFVGRTIDTHVSEGVPYGFDHFTDSHRKLNLELVGTVSCCFQTSSNGDFSQKNALTWKLTVTHLNKVNSSAFERAFFVKYH